MTKPPVILFLCVKNGGKSQMAAALARKHAAATLEIHSAGTTPGTKLNAESVQAIAESGVDMSSEEPKAIDVRLLSRVDHMVLVGDEVELPPNLPPGIEVRRWSTDEPSERGITGMERMRLVRDEIDTRVQNLISELISRP